MKSRDEPRQRAGRSNKGQSPGTSQGQEQIDSGVNRQARAGSWEIRHMAKLWSQPKGAPKQSWVKLPCSYGGTGGSADPRWPLWK